MLNRLILEVNRNKHLVLLFLISIIPFIITSNTGFDYFYGYEDFNITNLLQVWVDKDLGIIPAYQAPIYFIYYFCVYIWGHKLGSLIIWIFFINLGCIFVILLFREILFYLDVKTTNRIPEFIVGLFYISCIPIQFSINSPFSFNLIYPFSAIVFYLLFNLVNKRDNKSIIRTSILLALTSFFFLGLQIVFIIFLSICVVILLLYFILNSDIKLLTVIKLLTIFSILYVFISFPYYYTSVILPYTTQSDLVSEILTIENLSFTQSNSFLTEVYKILGGTSYYYVHKGEYSIPSAVDYFKNPIYIFLSYVGVISFSIFLIHFKSKKSNIKILLLSLFLISIFFMSGIHNVPLLQKIYLYLYNEHAIFSIFRNGIKMSFMLIIIYAISIGINMSQIKRNKNIIYPIIIFLLIMLNKPLYTVDFYKYADIILPTDVSDSIKYLNNLNERALVVPITPFPVYSFASRGVNPYEFSNQMKTVYNVNSAGRLNKILQNLDTQSDLFIYELKKMNIKYVIWNRYVDTKEYDLKDSIEYLDYYKDNFKEIKNFNNNVIIFEI